MMARRLLLGVAAGVVALALVAALLLGAEERNEALVVAKQTSTLNARVWAGTGSEACHVVRPSSSGGQESVLGGALAAAAAGIVDSALQHSFAALQVGVARAADGDAWTSVAGTATSFYEATREAKAADLTISPRLQCISVAIARFGEPNCESEGAFFLAAEHADPAGRFQAREPGCLAAKSMGIVEHPHLYVELHVEYHPTAGAFRLVPKVIYRRSSEAGRNSDLTLNVGVFTPAAATDAVGTRVSTVIVDLSGIQVGTDYSDVESLAIESYWTPMPGPPDQAALKRMLPNADMMKAVVPVNIVVTVEERETPSAVARFIADVFADNKATVRATITDLVESSLSSERTPPE